MMSSPPRPLPDEERFWSGVAYAQEFFRGTADVQHAMKKLAGILDTAGIPYAIAGAMALNEHGYIGSRSASTCS